MEFRILGPLEVVDGRRMVRLGPSRQRALLALLLLHANEVVSQERLIEDLWGERTPGTPGAALHTYVWQLRKLLEQGNDSQPRVLVTRAPGYVLEVDPGRVDVKRFELLARRGKGELVAGDTNAAAATLAGALALWRGPPLEEFGSAPFALAESLRLEGLRIAALEDRVDADLALGRHDLLVAELDALVADHPYRERLCGQLMLALYRSGRQSEALEAYRRTRRRLVEELGIEPGPALQALEKAILCHDPTLIVEPSSVVAESARAQSDSDAISVPERAVRRDSRRAGLHWQLVTAVVAVFVAITLAVGYAVRGGAPAAHLLAANSVGFVDAGMGRITKRYTVEGKPSSLAVVDNALWVANYEDATVTRIDRSTGDGLTIAVGAHLHPTGITGYAGRVWVWTLEGLLVPIDPRYDTAGNPIRLVARFSMRTPGKIAAGGGFLWITVPGVSVLRVDPARVERRQTIVSDWGAAGPVIDKGGEAWVAGADYSGYVYPIDDGTGAPGTGIYVGGPVHDLAIYANTLWVLSGGAVREQPHLRLRAVDLHDRIVRTTIEVGSDPLAVAVAAGSVWVANGADESISRVDPLRGRVVETIKLGASPIGLAADRNGLWVAAR